MNRILECAIIRLFFDALRQFAQTVYRSCDNLIREEAIVAEVGNNKRVIDESLQQNLRMLMTLMSLPSFSLFDVVIDVGIVWSNEI